MNFTRNITYLFSILFAVLLLTFNSVHAQTVALTETEQILLEKAEIELETENYQSASESFSQLLSLHTNEDYFRYKYAVCLINLNSNIDKAISYLKIADASGNIPQTKYYLGIAYHLQYMFDKAIKYYNDFLETDLSNQEKNKFPVHRQIAMANNGKKLVEYAYMLDIIKKRNLQIKDFFYSYDLEDINGEFLKKNEKFKTKKDKKFEKEPLMFVSYKYDLILYSSYGKNRKTGKDIYIVRKESNGIWGDPHIMNMTINTVEDEDYPYLHPDGKQLFFCSKGHNSMGGYDIFKSIFNPETNKWSIPKNMDFPINSPLDDILYANDSANNYAYFASKRYSENGRINTYKILINKDPEKRKIENIDDIVNTSLLNINVLAENLSYQKNETNENASVIEQKLTDTISTIQLTATNKIENPDILAYNNLKSKIENNLRNINISLEKLNKTQIQLKHIIVNSYEEKDFNKAITAFEIHNEYDILINKLQSDLDEFEDMFSKINLEETTNINTNIINSLETIEKNTNNIASTYKNYNPQNGINNKLDSENQNIKILKSKSKELIQKMADNIAESKNHGFSENDIKNNESLVKLQNKLISDYSTNENHIEEQKHIIENIINKKQLTETLFSENKTLDTSLIKIPKDEIKTKQFSQKQEFLSQLKKNRINTDNRSKSEYNIPKWYNSKSYQQIVENEIKRFENIQSPTTSESSNLNSSVLNNAISKREESLNLIKETKNQISEANIEEKENLSIKMNDALTDLKASNDIIQNLIIETNTTGINTDNSIANNIQNSNSENFIENPKERNIIISEVNNSMQEMVKKNEELNNNSKELKSVLSEKSQTYQSPPENISELKSERENFKKLTESVIELHQKNINNEKNINEDLKTQLNLFKIGKTHISAKLTGEIKKAIAFSEESESFQIAANNTKYPLKKLEFLNQAKEKIQQSNIILDQLISEITGENIYTVQDSKLPNTKNLNTFIRASQDYLTSLPTSENINPNPSINKYTDASIAWKNEQNKINFNTIDSLFSESEILQTKRVENLNPDENPKLLQKEDLIRYQIAENFDIILNNAKNEQKQRILQNTETINYLKECGLIENNSIPKNLDFTPSNSVYNLSTHDMTPIQVHAKIIDEANKFQTNMDVLFEQEKIINSTRQTKRAPLPSEWYDILNKTNRLSEPHILVDEKNIQLTKIDILNSGIAITPKEKQHIIKLQKQINKINIAINSLNENIEYTKTKDLSTEKTFKKLSNLEDDLIKQKINKAETQIMIENDYYRLNNEITNITSERIIKQAFHVSDSLMSYANEIITDIKTQKLNPQEYLRKTQYARGLMNEANLIQQKITEYDNTPIQIEILTAHISMYQQYIISTPSDKTQEPNSENKTNEKLETNDVNLLIAKTENQNSKKSLNPKISDEIKIIPEDKITNETDLAEDIIDYSEQIEISQIEINSDTLQEEDVLIAETESQNSEESLNSKISDEIKIISENKIANKTDLAVDIIDSSEQIGIPENKTNQDTTQQVNVLIAETDNYSINKEIENNNLSDSEIKYNSKSIETRNDSDTDLYYRIQVGAYSKPLKDTIFHGISPSLDEHVPNINLYRYLCGKFYNQDSLKLALPKVRNHGFTDAFAVAYYKLNRMSLNKAKEYIYLEGDLPSEFRIEGITKENQRTENPLNIATSIIPKLTDSDKTFYSVQLGAFRQLLSPEKVQYINADFYAITTGEYYKYYHGKFDNFADANAQKRNINRMIPDAFVVAFKGGKRISTNTAAKELQDKSRSSATISSIQNKNNTKNKKISFQIQIGAFRNTLNAIKLKNFETIFFPYKVSFISRGDYQIYSITGFNSYQEAGKALKAIVKPVVGDAFVTAYLNGNKISIREALKLTQGK